MPIYEFECQSCGTIFELFLKGKESKESVTCGSCGSSEVNRVMSSFGFRTRQRIKGEYKPDPECRNGTCVPHERPKELGWGSKDYVPGQYLKKLPEYKDMFD